MLRKRANDFEDFVQRGFAAIREKTGAWLYWVNPPMVPTRFAGKCPLYAPTGSALYDIGGWTGPTAVPQAIGFELKATGKFEKTLPIIAPGKKGGGLQYHQLEALAAMHRDGHMAGLLWNNAGIVGYCVGETLAAAFYDYEVSRASEEMNKKVQRGVRSLSWGKFTTVQADEPEAFYIEGFHNLRT